MNVANALLFLFPDADPLRDYRVQDDGKGAYIAVWNLANPQPTTRHGRKRIAKHKHSAHRCGTSHKARSAL